MLCIGGLLPVWPTLICAENCPDKVLKWPERLAVLIGVAKAVHFLHTGVIPGSFNSRLKTNNILLDEHRIAKLSDYGMSIVMEENEKVEVCFSWFRLTCWTFLISLLSVCSDIF